MSKTIPLTLSALVAAMSVGCASVAVTSDKLEKNTAFALGIEKGAFTISDRVDDGLTTTFKVKANSGNKYSCYVTGIVSITGREVSDAICKEIVPPQATVSKEVAPPEAKNSKKPTKKSSNTTCDALSKEAGRC